MPPTSGGALGYAAAAAWTWAGVCGRDLGLSLTGRPQEAAAEEIEARPAKHLAFQHFQAVDVPLDRAGTPGQGDARFDRLIVVAEPVGKALHGLQRTGSRAREPGIEVLRLALADEGGKVLREVDRLGDLGRLRVELGELLGLGLGALAPHAAAPARSPGGASRAGTTGSATTGRRLAPALAAGWDALGLADAADIGGDAAIAPGVAPRLELPKQLDGGVAAGIPALQDIGLIRVEDAASVVAAMLPHRPRRQAADTARWCDSCSPPGRQWPRAASPGGAGSRPARSAPVAAPRAGRPAARRVRGWEAVGQGPPASHQAAGPAAGASRH